MKRNSRSSRISWIIFVCNLLLAVVAFVCYFGESSQLGYLAPVSYSVPMNCYILMTYLLFILVVLSVPAVAGGSISLEREKKTLDVLLTTNLNPWRIITGKLEASLGVVLILTVSALPVLSLVVVFGGIGLAGKNLTFPPKTRTISAELSTNTTFRENRLSTLTARNTNGRKVIFSPLFMSFYH